MLYDLVRVRRGKESVRMTDTAANCKARMIVLKNSQRGGGNRITYFIRPSESKEKYFKRHKFRSH